MKSHLLFATGYACAFAARLARSIFFLPLAILAGPVAGVAILAIAALLIVLAPAAVVAAPVAILWPKSPKKPAAAPAEGGANAPR